MFLGIDQSFKSTGLVVTDKDANLVHFETIKNKDISNKIKTSFLITKRIEEIITVFNPEKVFMEGMAFFRSGRSQLDLAGLFYMINSKITVEINKPLYIVPPIVLKDFATGNVKADKTEMINCLPKPHLEKFEKKGFKKTNGLADIADAYYLSTFHLKEDLEKWRQI